MLDFHLRWKISEAKSGFPQRLRNIDLLISNLEKICRDLIIKYQTKELWILDFILWVEGNHWKLSFKKWIKKGENTQWWGSTPTYTWEKVMVISWELLHICGLCPEGWKKGDHISNCFPIPETGVLTDPRTEPAPNPMGIVKLVSRFCPNLLLEKSIPGAFQNEVIFFFFLLTSVALLLQTISLWRFFGFPLLAFFSK